MTASRWLGWSVGCLAAWMVPAAEKVVAQLVPEQVAVIVAAGNPESRSVAEHYLTYRQLPPNRILEVDFPAGSTLARNVWEDEVRSRIAAQLRELDPDGQVTDLVVVYGTPLAVGAWEDDRELRVWEAFYQQAIDDGVGRLNEALAVLSKLAEQDAPQLALPLNLAELRQQFQRKIESAQQAIAGSPADEQAALNSQLQAQVQVAAGLFPFLSSLQQQLQNPAQSGQAAAMQKQFEYLRGRSEALTQTVQYLERMPASFEREAAIVALLEQGGGLLDVLTWLQRQMDLVQMNDSLASLDSELALIFWEDYRRIGTVPNLLNPAFDGSPLRRAYRTLRVSRIDGPTAEVAKQLVDRARAADQQEQMSGKVYIDLRGIQSGDPNLLQTENWLRAVGEQLAEVDGLQVEFEETAKLFQTGQCPDALVYLGWYSLGRYVDACEFQPGAIAYHLVPGDALRLRDAEHQGWCRGLLENGATRVIGSVGEAVPVLIAVDPKGPAGPQSLSIIPAELSDGMIIFAAP